MNRWRFAFSKRWFGYLAVAIVFAVVCVLLANWQLARREEKEAQIELVERNYDSDPVALTDAIASLDDWNPDDEWQPVQLTGTYVESEQVLVRNRPYNGQPGFDVLTPIRTTDGSVFIVDRGWLPTGSEQDLPDAVPAPPKGEVTVVARLKEGEPTLPGRSAPEGQIATIQLDDLADRIGEPTYTGAYGQLVSENPAPTEERPLAIARPVSDEGPHLSYAFQWFVFGALGFAFLGYAIRQEYRHLNADDPAEQKRAAERERKRAARRTDADIEDEIIEAAQR